MKYIQIKISQITSSTADLLNGFGDIRELKSENLRQRHEIERLNREIVRLLEAENENRILRTLLKHGETNPEWEAVAANIIGYDPTNLAETVIIDKGTDDGLQKGMVVMDIVYSPLQTRLITAARSRGCLTIDGLGMFIHQGAEQFRLWTGLEAPISAMTRAVKQALKEPARQLPLP